MEPTSPWKRPDEVMQLHRLKRRKKALQERMKQPLNSSTDAGPSAQNTVDLDFSRILEGDKRKINPFSKNNTQQSKKTKLSNESSPLDESNDKTLFALLKLPAKTPEKPAKKIETDKLSTFSNLLQKYTAEHTVEVQTTEQRYKHLPVDWAIKTKLRLMSPKPFAWSQQLKASEEASGITGFVRCLDTTSSPTLDTSPRARFHQTCLYWQQPALPWLSLHPRAAGRVAATSFLAAHDHAKQALLRDWTESFRSLFQLLRARHCPYFYVCANTFTCLFRAGGLGGVGEPSALVGPTTRGLRHALRQEDVEYTMPLRPDSKKKLNTSDKEDDRPKNSSFDSCYDTMDEARSPEGQGKESGDEEDLDSDKFLSQLGFENDVIKKINNTQARIQNSVESSVDSAAESLVFVRGVDAQALFNFLLNCKSIVSPTGPYAGVPPTLLAPTAFQGGTLQSLKVKESSIYSDNNKYYSIELRGPILPTTVHSLLRVVRDSCAEFSGTFAHHRPTLAFTYAARDIARDETPKENEANNFTNAFSKENLSDCGLSADMLQQFCSPDPDVIRVLDSVTYNSEDDTFSW
ncbi:protein downstream neighbor of son homolog [Plutella xylostella]|uniref:protein downstream neighbor of son homolog n=1 Tax=Plutella xylostella TaxID=51655 RepID=UPI002032C185|nr:protein downstream neighbor of son homolog [Plutella xylostella]